MSAKDSKPCQTAPLLQLTAAARSGVWLVVRFTVRPERVTEAQALFRRHVDDGQRDAGNLLFVCLHDADAPTRFTTLEAWGSQAAIDRHDAQPHHERFLRALGEIQAEEKTVLAHRFHAG